MSRAAQLIVGALVAATIGAFFVTQHLKSTTPVLTGNPYPSPGAISPGSRACGGQYAQTKLSFYLLHRADDVSVYVVDSSGTIVRTLASGRHMRRGVRHPDGDFIWNGRGDDGRVVPDGVYTFRVALIHQNRTIEIKDPVTVKTVAPHPAVRRVTAGGASPALLPAPGGARIDYTGDQGHAATVQVYRTDGRRVPTLVSSFLSGRSPAIWDGRIQGQAAPAGIYLVGLSVTDRACNTGRFPAQIPPTPGSTTGAGVTVRNIAALPPLDGVAGGGAARVFVDSRRRPYTWALRRQGAAHTVGLGHGTGPVVRVGVPFGGLYELAIASSAGRVELPVVAHSSTPSGGILVVLPALTWQGLNPSDARGEGLPVTLDTGGPADLSRPFTSGSLPAGVPDEAALLAYLDAAHLRYDVTTDLGLLDGVGPGLAGHTGVVLAGSERWAPASLTGPLVAYVRRGGRVLSLGVDSLRRSVTLKRATSGAGWTAVSPGQPAVADALGASIGPFVGSSPGVILTENDGLGMFTGTSGALPGFTAFQPITGTVPPAGKILSAMGPSSGSAAVAGWRIGSGIVMEAGLPGFGSALAANVDARELLRQMWTILSH